MSSPNSSDQSASLGVSAAFPPTEPLQLDGIDDANEANIGANGDEDGKLMR